MVGYHHRHPLAEIGRLQKAQCPIRVLHCCGLEYYPLKSKEETVDILGRYECVKDWQSGKINNFQAVAYLARFLSVSKIDIYPKMWEVWKIEAL